MKPQTHLQPCTNRKRRRRSHHDHRLNFTFPDASHSFASQLEYAANGLRSTSSRHSHLGTAVWTPTRSCGSGRLFVVRSKLESSLLSLLTQNHDLSKLRPSVSQTGPSLLTRSLSTARRQSGTRSMLGCQRGPMRSSRIFFHQFDETTRRH